MTPLLATALAKIEEFPKNEQDAIASQILDSLAEEAEWQAVFAANKTEIKRLAHEALVEVRRGTTSPLEELLASFEGTEHSV